MLVGVPKEIKTHEYRVGLVPGSVRELAYHGHQVLVETGAGLGIGFDDKAYEAAGAKIARNAEEVFAKAEMVVKVKEPQPQEWAQLKEGQVLFTYLHLAPDPGQTRDLLKSGVTAIAYETVTSPRGGLPLLAPMSEVAGRMSIQAGARCLEKEAGGRGVLLGGVPGVEPAKVVILGGGVVGSHAALMAVGAGAVPQGYLSYYSARTACENAGKRLCTEDEWVHACRGPGYRLHPYGEQFVQGACNVNRLQHPAFVLHGNSSLGHLDPRLNLVFEQDAGPLLRETASSPRCISPWDAQGVYDMEGNLDEWIKAVVPKIGADRQCVATPGTRLARP